MDRELPTPGTVIARQTAEQYPCAVTIARFWNHCANHAVTTCETCRNLWRLDQLRRKAVGYYPGEPPPPTRDLEHAPTTPPTVELAPGNRYALTCPLDGQDLTTMCLLHYDLCTTASAHHPTPTTTPPLDK